MAAKIRIVFDGLIIMGILLSMGRAEYGLPSSKDAPIYHPDCSQIDNIQYPKMLRYPGNCNKYFSCLKGLAYPKTCPNDMQWSELTQRCDYAEIVKCKDNNNNSNPPSYSLLSPPATAGYPYFYQSHPHDSHKFYQCTLEQCPSHFQWSSALNSCVSPPPAQIPSESSLLPAYDLVPSAATAPPTLRPTDSPVTPEIPGYMPHSDEDALNALCSKPGVSYLHYPNDCRKFIHCNGVANVQTCPDGLFWNEELLTCDRECK